MDYSLLMIKMVIFAFLLLTGYIGARKGFLAPGFAQSASWLLLHVFLVASIINAVLGERPELTGRALWGVMLLLSGCFALYYLLGTVMAHFGQKELAPMTICLLGGMNNLFVGLPVLQTVCGSEAVFYMGLSNVPFNLFLYTYGVWHYTRGREGAKFQWKKMISCPLVASLAALLIFVLNIHMPRLVTELCSTVSAATVPISMLVIGATLGPVSLRSAFADRRVYLIAFVKLIVFPLLTYVLLKGRVNNEILFISCVVLGGCPCGAVNTPVAIQYGYDATYTSKLILVTTFLSMITLPVLLYVLF